MKITEITIRPNPKTKSSVEGFASVTFDDSLVVTNISIIKGKNGYFIGMPSRKGSDDEYYDLVFPKTKELRTKLTDAIMAKFKTTDLAKDVVDDDDDDEGIPF